MRKSAAQAEAIARNLREMARLAGPGGGVCIGGRQRRALALGVGNTGADAGECSYSVIPPESCAAIIYRDSG